MKKGALFLLIFLFICFQICEVLASVNYSQDINSLKEQYSYNKQIPEKYEMPILLALSKYPELNETRINFKEKTFSGNINIKPTITFALKEEPVSITMASRPSWNFIFKKKENIQYNVFINNGPLGTNISDLSLNSQVGILGHELAHIIDYLPMSKLQISTFGIKYKFSEKFRSQIEKKTDEEAINRGLGREIYNFTSFIYNDKSVPKGYLEYKKRVYYSPEEILKLVEKYENSSKISNLS